MSEMGGNREAARLLARALGPAGPELDCDECFAMLDLYVELELAGADPDGGVPGMRAHLEGCPACEEEHRSLMALAANAGASEEPPSA